MRLIVVGNRRGWSYLQVKNSLDFVIDLFHLSNKDTVIDLIISGGADGVDSHAEKYAVENNIKFLPVRPDIFLPFEGKNNRYFVRNRKMVEMAKKKDFIIAFNKFKKSGTTNTINYARKLKKNLIIIT